MCIDPDRAIRESNGEDIVVGIRLDSKGDRGLLEVNSSQKSTIGDIKYYELIKEMWRQRRRTMNDFGVG